MITFELKKSNLDSLFKYIKDKELANIFSDRLVSKSIYEYFDKQDEKFEITLELKESEKLLDYLSDILMEKGFNEHYELTSIGRDVESLIDIFNYYDK
jgi:hypothetical protein